MLGALSTAATGMDASSKRVDVISNNLANASTTGFKKSRIDFADMLYRNLRVKGATDGSGVAPPTGVEIGTGTRHIATVRSYELGSLAATGNALDLAIEGAGFFQVVAGGGEIRYTRAGALHTDAEGRLVTGDGYPLEPSISIPSEATAVSVAADGTVSVVMAGDPEPQEVGKIELAGFVNAPGLNAEGKNLFAETAASGAPQTGTPGAEGLGTIASGFLEGSNVNVVEEMVQLIVAQRAYEVNSRVISTADEMLERAVNVG